MPKALRILFGKIKYYFYHRHQMENGEDDIYRKTIAHLNALSRSLTTRIEKLSELSPLPQLYRSCIEVSKYRILELVQDAVGDWERGRNLSSFILSRSIFETVLMVQWVNSHIEEFLDGKINFEKMKEILMLSMHGSRLEDSPLEARNIVSIIKNLDKRQGKTGDGLGSNERIYSWFSAYPHPNTEGSFMLYAKIDKNARAIDLSSNMSPILSRIVIDSIRMSLSIFEKNVQIQILYFPEFVQKTEELIKK